MHYQAGNTSNQGSDADRRKYVNDHVARRLNMTLTRTEGVTAASFQPL